VEVVGIGALAVEQMGFSGPALAGGVAAVGAVDEGQDFREGKRPGAAAAKLCASSPSV
jgi:hypothetical protein